MVRRKWENPLDKMSRGFYNAVVRHQTFRACTAEKFMDREMTLPIGCAYLHVCGRVYCITALWVCQGVEKNFFLSVTRARARSGARARAFRRAEAPTKKGAKREEETQTRRRAFCLKKNPTKTAQNDQFWSAEKKAGKQVNFRLYFTSLFFNPRKGVATPLIDALS